MARTTSFGTAVAKNKLIPVVIAFAINYAAYFAEIYRGGIESIPVGQYEAAERPGLHQGADLPAHHPAAGGQAHHAQHHQRGRHPRQGHVHGLHASPIEEMFTIGKQIANSQTSFMPFLVAGVFYFVFNAIVDLVMGKIEKRMDYYQIRRCAS